MNEMKFFSKAKSVLLGFAQKVLDVEQENASYYPKNTFDEYLSRFDFDTSKVGEVPELLRLLQKKHLVDSICVASSNGSLVASSNGDDFTQALTGTALFNYVQSELPKSEALLVKSNGWYMVFPFRKKIFIIRAFDSLSTLEMKAIANEIEGFLSKK